MIPEVLNGLLLPFFGTSAGAALVLVLRGQAPERLTRVLNGFAAGIMAAASVFSLLLPAMEETERNGGRFWAPACFGFLLGAGLLAAWDRISLLRARSGRVSHSTRMLVLSVCLHNVPEGMAVGAAYAGLLSGSAAVTVMSAFSLSLGIALQNLPEGAIVSMPLYAGGVGRKRAFLLGVLSGASEPVAGGLTILLARFAVPALPWLLSFAAGAMAYVVGFELIFTLLKERPRSPGLLCVFAGFALMTAMDVLLG
ncbi:MAG: ZIP family metal transporter [Clostridia bacterium]|nr:ZIP family metal transporter [Clostridia bacterium]